MALLGIYALLHCINIVIPLLQNSFYFIWY